VKRALVCLLGAVALATCVSSCTPALVAGALAGGAYAGYNLGREGYSIQITKPVKGKKVIVDNSTATKK